MSGNSHPVDIIAQISRLALPPQVTIALACGVHLQVDVGGVCE